MMKQLKLDPNHNPHDTRHTFATRMDRTHANKLCINELWDMLVLILHLKYIHIKI